MSIPPAALAGQKPYADNGLTRPLVQRMAIGVVLPKGDMTLAFRVQVDGKGDIFQTTLNGYQYIGNVDTRGNYRFVNGLQGNCFRDGQFELKIEHAENPFQKALLDSKQQRASTNSIVPLIRRELTANGIDGRGITVADIEPFETMSGLKTPDNPEGSEEQESLIVSPHSQAVAAVIQDPYWGVAPGAVVKNFGWTSPEYELKEDNLAEFNQMTPVQQVYQEMNQQLDRVIQAHREDPSLRVVNISWGLTLLEFYVEILSALHEEDEKTGHVKFPQLRQAVLGPTQQGTREEQFLAVQKYVNNVLNQTPVFRNLHQQFILKTKLAADEGITIVLSAANAHDQLPFATSIPKGHEMTLWANSPYVISVAASDTNLTPEDSRDDVVAPFSSRGDGKQWNPTIAAPGSEIGITQQYGPIGLGLVIKGTSYSSPTVAGIVTMMLQQNPSLTFNDIKQRLIATAVDTPASFEAEGHGMLDPIAAVKSAKVLNQSKN